MMTIPKFVGVVVTAKVECTPCATVSWRNKQNYRAGVFIKTVAACYVTYMQK
jgi:hypothetical protein